VRSRRLIAPAFVALALGLAAAGCGGSSGGGPASASKGPSAATIAPTGAAAFVSVNTDLGSDQLKKVQKLLSRFPGRDKLYAQIEKSLLEQNVDFDRDVKPALGPEIDFVWTDFANGGSDVVALTKPADEKKFDALLDKDKTNKYVKTKIDGWTVVSQTQAVLDKFKQASSSGEKLTDDATFKTATAKLPGEAVAIAYVSGSALQSAGLSGGTTGAQNAQLAWIAAALSAQDDGVKLLATVKTPQDTGTPSAAGLLDEVPAGAIALIWFNGAVSGGTVEQLRANPALQQGIAPFEKLLGLSLPQLLSLFQGEAALYVRQGTPFPEVTLVVRESNELKARADADTIVSKLTAGLANGSKPQAATVAGVPAKRVLLGPVAIYYAVFGGKLVITDSTLGISALKDTGGSKMSGDSAFKDATKAAGMPAKTLGFVYVSLKDAVPLVENLAQIAAQSIPPDVSANLAPLSSLVLYGTRSGSEASVHGFLQIR
jgi:hypothetical protein